MERKINIKPLDDLAAGEFIQDQYQPRNHKLFKTHVPSANEIGEMEIMFSSISGTIKLHTKINGVVYSTTLT